ncbi:L-type lectin-domain containing receptor kinase IV.2-like [Iris pallida]|uniref:L-type lectin-domain containing receptor kinase IV.2-like n=1 Tax=Iris pallida TaxID=29817 RepID=A0AAX6EM87_IRIPA|nr:L-type lectin-domain containing receptor kinase IV.2-like [Iris pallida]KAJ6843960.1 L-type lectin-domain containing receptor kinase IV.2-like [Iris pallida]
MPRTWLVAFPLSLKLNSPKYWFGSAVEKSVVGDTTKTSPRPRIKLYLGIIAKTKVVENDRAVPGAVSDLNLKGLGWKACPSS